MQGITAQGLALIKRFEGFSAVPYLCPAGHWTVGWGHVLPAHEAQRWKTGVEEAQLQQWLEADVEAAVRAVGRLIRVPLTQGQRDALVSFTFNLGSGALQRSALRRKVNRGEQAAVPKEFLRWVWAGGRRLEGLVRRREAEALRYTCPT